MCNAAAPTMGGAGFSASRYRHARRSRIAFHGPKRWQPSGPAPFPAPRGNHNGAAIATGRVSARRVKMRTPVPQQGRHPIPARQLQLDRTQELTYLGDLTCGPDAQPLNGYGTKVPQLQIPVASFIIAGDRRRAPPLSNEPSSRDRGGRSVRTWQPLPPARAEDRLGVRAGWLAFSSLIARRIFAYRRSKRSPLVRTASMAQPSPLSGALRRRLGRGCHGGPPLWKNTIKYKWLGPVEILDVRVMLRGRAGRLAVLARGYRPGDFKKE
jgi:hypothetical protein